MKPQYFNRTQLARQLGIAPATLNLKIAAGQYVSDAQDGKGNDLFSEKSVSRAKQPRRARS